MRRHTTTMNMTEGRPLALLSVFALPLLIGNLFQQAYNLADSMIVGQILGADSLAAVGATGSISFLFFSIFNGISGGCGIVTAQYFGARNDRMVCKSIANSAYIMLASSVFTGVMWPINSLFRSTKEAVAASFTVVHPALIPQTPRRWHGWRLQICLRSHPR